MVTKSKLKAALLAEKGVDFKKLKQKKKAKEAEKRKQSKAGGADEDESSEDEEEQADSNEAIDEVDEEEEEGDEEEEAEFDIDAVNDSDSSESSIELEEKIPRKSALKKATAIKATEEAEEDEEEEEEDEEDVPMSDLEDLDEADKEDLIPHQRLTINNTTALLAALKRIAIPTDTSVPFATHQSVLASATTAESIPDVSDDLQRELAFYTQSLEAVRLARKKLRAEGVPFSRPKDYFAEMVKEDAHMEKVKAKLVEEATNKKAAAEARKLRDLKKFGKQVQVAKLQERQKAKRETLEKIKTLKRKRQENSGDLGTHEADIFDVAVDHELEKHNQRSGAGRGQSATGAVNHKRQKKNEKYGFGGKKRHAKSGDAVSSGDLSGFNAKKMKAKGKVTKSRPGKARRKAMGSR